MTTIYIDGDACPVKEEVFRAADKRSLKVFVVANTYIHTPPCAESVVVKGNLDAADDYIAEHSGPGDAVVTADIGLASRALKTGAAAIAPTGREFTDENIGTALATRDIMKQIRQATGREIGPKPFSDKDRRKFMKEFSQMLEALARK
jgi:uncharacterized protein